MLRLFRHLLEQAGFATQCFASAADFFASNCTAEVGCLVVNFDMPAMSGLELVKALRQEPAVPLIIVATAEDTVEACRDALRNGAWDFLAKPIDHANLVARVERALTVHHQRWLKFQDTIEFAHRLDQLTERERFVMERLAAGQKMKQIARAMGIGFQTVSKHGIRAFEKLRVDNDVQLALQLQQLDSLRSQRLARIDDRDGVDERR
ncbi:MAG: response regulator [Planctomycetaceae bacterium]|nr:response regulator [Planctomycetaceae bacterium]